MYSLSMLKAKLRKKSCGEYDEMKVGQLRSHALKAWVRVCGNMRLYKGTVFT